MRLFLIDGAALAYRSHFAFINNPLTNSRGMQTSALFGFTTTLLRIIEKEKPDLLAVVFDSKEETFRHQTYPAYKATREKMPDELSDQIPYIQKIAEALRIPYLTLPTFEADDIIGTIAKRAERKEIDTYMVSADKDFLQLVGPHVFLYNMKKGAEVEISGAEGPMKKWGVPADRVIDLLALMGDASDNVPGVPGVGEKTATKLIQTFGSIDDIYRRIEEVTPEKLRQKLQENQDQAHLCRDLVTIRTEVPIQVDPMELKRNGFDMPRLTELFQELDFHSLLESFAKQQGKRTNQSTESYTLVKDAKGLDMLLRDLKSSNLFSFDTETTSLHPVDAQPIGFSFATQSKFAFYVPLVNHELPQDALVAKFKPILEDPSQLKGGQNVKYDRLVLKNVGIHLQGIAFDTLLESYLLEPGARQHGIDSLALKHFGIQKILTTELIGKGTKQISMLDVDLNRLSHYACEDADLTLRLHHLFAPQIEHQELTHLYREVELPLVEVLGDMERQGVAINRGRLEKLSKEVAIRLAELTKEIYKEVGEEFNINSPKQLGPILFEKLRIQDHAGVKRVKKTQTGYATDQETLENYEGHPIVKLLLEYRNLSKLLSTYIDALPALLHPKTGRIHTSFNQTVAATGRLSSSDPNLQNIPIRTDLGKEIRKAFIASEKGWKILSADYSQIELRILAHLSDDANLIETFQKNEDVHRRTASLIFGVPLEKVGSDIRNRAKAINFGVIYGMGPQRLARETGLSLAEAKAFIEAYFEKYPRVKRYLDKQIDQARENGFVKTLLGRRREIPDILSVNPRLSSNAERIATNTPIQGSAADLIKVAMVTIYRKLKEEKLKTRMLLQVHDELVFESPEDEIKPASELIKEGMEKAIALKVPVVVELGVGSNWAEAH